MNLTERLLGGNSTDSNFIITLLFFVALLFCYPSSFLLAQTYYPPYPTQPIYPPSSNINPYPPNSNIYPQNSSPLLGLAQYGIRQAVSPWFPSIPAISCGLGKFSFNVLGVPDKGGEPEQDELMAIKIIASNNGRIITDKDVSGLIFVGEENIEDNDGEDFDIKTLFNDCQTLMYSR